MDSKDVEAHSACASPLVLKGSSPETSSQAQVSPQQGDASDPAFQGHPNMDSKDVEAHSACASPLVPAGSSPETSSQAQVSPQQGLPGDALNNSIMPASDTNLPSPRGHPCASPDNSKCSNSHHFSPYGKPQGRDENVGRNKKASLKMEQDEALGHNATIAAVLHANMIHPEFQQEFPKWPQRRKQVVWEWRLLPLEKRAPYIQLAKENRTNARMKKTQQEQPLLLEDSVEEMKRKQEQRSSTPVQEPSSDTSLNGDADFEMLTADVPGISKTQVSSPQISSVPLFNIPVKPAPPLPPGKIVTEQDRQLQVEYEQWLLSTDAVLTQQIKYYHTEVQKMSKIQKSFLHMKRRNLQRNDDSLALKHADKQLKKAQKEKTVIRKRLKAARVQSQAHAIVMKEYQTKQDQKNAASMASNASTAGQVPESPQNNANLYSGLKAAGVLTPEPLLIQPQKLQQQSYADTFPMEKVALKRIEIISTRVRDGLGLCEPILQKVNCGEKLSQDDGINIGRLKFSVERLVTEIRSFLSTGKTVSTEVEEKIEQFTLLQVQAEELLVELDLRKDMIVPEPDISAQSRESIPPTVGSQTSNPKL